MDCFRKCVNEMSCHFFFRFFIVMFVVGITSSTENTKEKILPLDDENQNNIILDGNKLSFPAVLKTMEESLKAAVNDEACFEYEPEKPNFQVSGRRVSEVECLNYIWEIKKEEETQKILEQCPDLSGIVGGHQGKTGEYAHMGAIGWKDVMKGRWAFKCGGSLVSDRFVLTAAHCEFDENRKHPKIVRFGVVNIANETLIANGDGVDIKILKFRRHPDYMPDYKNYDIALIELVHKVQFSNTIQPACLMKQRPINEAAITGWGALSNENDSVISDVLQVAEVDVLPIRQCRESWRQKWVKRNWKGYFVDQMCARSNTADICGGDSGGPLQSKLHTNTKQSIHNIIGVTAFNYACGSQRFPSVYTRAQFHMNWIENVVWGVNHKQISRLDNNPTKNNTEMSTTLTPEVTGNAVKINRVQDFENGRLFWFDTMKGSEWSFIAQSEIAGSSETNVFDLVNNFI